MPGIIIICVRQEVAANQCLVLFSEKWPSSFPRNHCLLFFSELMTWISRFSLQGSSATDPNTVDQEIFGVKNFSLTPYNDEN